MVSFSSMASVRRLCALFLLIASALLGAASGCSLISDESDCQGACEVLGACGSLSVSGSSACAGYCAATVVGVGEAGCDAQFEAQNSCVTANVTTTTCSKLSACTSDVTAFTMCFAAYCKKNPSTQGCPN